jgi:hypothetical protein
MLVKAVGILSIASVGGPTTRLHIPDAIGAGAEYAEKRFRMHGARADFHVVRLLEGAALLHPELRELQNEVLKV